MERVFINHTDPGHGWTEVPYSLLVQLGIHDKISPYSYRCRNTCYLEEDCDAPKFYEAFRAKYGKYPELEEKFHPKNAPLRKYYKYFFTATV